MENKLEIEIEKIEDGYIMIFKYDAPGFYSTKVENKCFRTSLSDVMNKVMSVLDDIFYTEKEKKNDRKRIIEKD